MSSFILRLSEVHKTVSNFNGYQSVLIGHHGHILSTSPSKRLESLHSIHATEAISDHSYQNIVFFQLISIVLLMVICQLKGGVYSL